VSVIVHLGKFFNPDRGGVESVTSVAARGAVLAGHSVSVVCFASCRVRETVIMEGVKVIRAPIAWRRLSQPFSVDYLAACCEEGRTADIVHVHVPNFSAIIAALLLPRRVRIVVHWHSDVVGKGIVGWLLQPLEYAILRRAKRILVTSLPYAESSNALKAYKQKIEIVPIGIPDVRNNKHAQCIPSSIEEFLRGRRFVLSVGRLVAYKGYETLIRATADLPADVAVVVVGEGPLTGRLNALVEMTGSSDRILFTGRLGDVELHALWSRASLFCLSSETRAEAFGVVLLEAMSFGLPVVSTDIAGSGVGWVNSNGVSGLHVRVQDARSLAAACSRILTSESLRRELSLGARKRFLDNFTEERSVSLLLRAYSVALS
jgi:glycosyltransferase involved in cell wall biosynthesis